MYGIVRPKDLIGNYKLPIEVRGLYDFWGNKIAKRIIAENPDYIINLLPKSYEKLLKIRENLGQLKERNIKILNMIFVSKNGEKFSHNTKVLRGKFLKNVVENMRENFLESIQFEDNGEIIREISILVE
jgi:hypothetical protein